MSLTAFKDVATIAGVCVGAGALVFTAINTWLTLQTNRARFWLDLRDRFAKHDEVHRRLRPGGEWSTSQDAGPSTPEQWAQVEAYMGLFEHCEVMLGQRLIDRRTFQDIYGYRLNNLVTNRTICRAKLVEQKAGWVRFLALLARIGVEMP